MEIYPLKIYLPETMYRMMWDYFFPEEDDSQRRQVSSKSRFIKNSMFLLSTPSLSFSLDIIFISDNFDWVKKDIWRVSTSTGSRRTRRTSSGADAVASTSYSIREHELAGKSGTTVSTSINVSNWQGLHGDNSQVSHLRTN